MVHIGQIPYPDLKNHGRLSGQMEKQLEWMKIIKLLEMDRGTVWKERIFRENDQKSTMWGRRGTGVKVFG